MGIHEDEFDNQDECDYESTKDRKHERKMTPAYPAVPREIHDSEEKGSFHQG